MYKSHQIRWQSVLGSRHTHLKRKLISRYQQGGEESLRRRNRRARIARDYVTAAFMPAHYRVHYAGDDEEHEEDGQVQALN